MESPLPLGRTGVVGLLRTPISRSLKVGILSSFILRLAGSATAVLLVKYLNTTVAHEHGLAHMDSGTVAALSAIFYVTELVMSPVLGALSDRWGRKPFLIVGPILGALAVQIHPLTTIIFVLAFGRLFEGLATASNVPATLGFLADGTSSSAALRGRVMGLYEVASLVGIVTGPSLGAVLWEGLHWQAGGISLPALGINGMRVLSLVYLSASALIFFFIGETAVARSGAMPTVADELRARLRGYRDLLRVPRLINFIPAWLTVNAVLGLWLTHIVALLTRELRNPHQLLEGGYKLSDTAPLFIAFGVIFTAGILFWSLLYARMRKTTLMLMAVGGTIGVCLSGLALNNQVLPSPPGEWPLLVPLFLSLFVMSGFTPVALAYLADISEERAQDRGMVMGLYSVLFGIGQLGGGLLGVPFIAAFGFNGLLLLTGLLALLGLGVIAHLRRVTGD